MMQILAVSNDGIWELPVQSVEWSGAKHKAPRSVVAKILSTTKGMHQKTNLKEGNGIVFLWKEQELFRGTLFRQEISKNGTLIITAYDNLVYLIKNTDSYVFTSQKASDILKRICSDFQIQMGQISDTGYVIPSLVCPSKTLYDMVMTALLSTYEQTGKRFYLYSKEGKVNLAKRSDNTNKWVIEDGANLVDYSFTSSIEDTKTKVKLETGEEKATIIATAENKSLQEMFGVLQYYEKVPEELNKAQLQQRADQILKDKGKIHRSFDLSGVLGLTDVISGGVVYVIAQELGIKKAYYIDADTHVFEGNKHLMDLVLNEADDLPEVV